jgi:CrcB protein
MPELLVAIGSAVGGLARYWLGVAAVRAWGNDFPFVTLIINVSGSFIIGLFAALTMASGAVPASPNARLFVMTGLCGGFTTFSAFSLQSVELMRNGSWIPAMAYMAGSLVLCVGAAMLGTSLGLLLASASTLES